MKNKAAIAVCIISYAVFAIACIWLTSFKGTQQTPNASDFETDIAASSIEEDNDDPTNYISPIDFESLRSVNPDIVAWLEIPQTEISYPILFKESDNSFYLTHGSDKAYSKNGSLFIENYNQPNFEDPVTIIYGHNMRSKAMFGTLQQTYSDADWFLSNQTINIYLPDKTIFYSVFAAVPYSNRHILYYNDFSNERQFKQFFDGIYSTRSLKANFNNQNNPTFNNRVLILSTCLNGDRNQRYIVLAKELSDAK